MRLLAIIAFACHLRMIPKRRVRRGITRTPSRRLGMILASHDRVHPDTYVLTMVSNVIGMVNYVIAARPSLRNLVIADTPSQRPAPPACLKDHPYVKRSTRCQRRSH
jgi:hypothetical protein